MSKVPRSPQVKHQQPQTTNTVSTPVHPARFQPSRPTKNQANDVNGRGKVFIVPPQQEAYEDDDDSINSSRSGSGSSQEDEYSDDEEDMDSFNGNSDEENDQSIEDEIEDGSTDSDNDSQDSSHSGDDDEEDSQDEIPLPPPRRDNKKVAPQKPQKQVPQVVKTSTKLTIKPKQQPHPPQPQRNQRPASPKKVISKPVTSPNSLKVLNTVKKVVTPPPQPQPKVSNGRKPLTITSRPQVVLKQQQEEEEEVDDIIEEELEPVDMEPNDNEDFAENVEAMDELPIIENKKDKKNKKTKVSNKNPKTQPKPNPPNRKDDKSEEDKEVEQVKKVPPSRSKKQKTKGVATPLLEDGTPNPEYYADQLRNLTIIPSTGYSLQFTFETMIEEFNNQDDSQLNESLPFTKIHQLLDDIVTLCPSFQVAVCTNAKDVEKIPFENAYIYWNENKKDKTPDELKEDANFTSNVSSVKCRKCTEYAGFQDIEFLSVGKDSITGVDYSKHPNVDKLFKKHADTENQEAVERRNGNIKLNLKYKFLIEAENIIPEAITSSTLIENMILIDRGKDNMVNLVRNWSTRDMYHIIVLREPLPDNEYVLIDLVMDIKEEIQKIVKDYVTNYMIPTGLIDQKISDKKKNKKGGGGSSAYSKKHKKNKDYSSSKKKHGKNASSTSSSKNKRKRNDNKDDEGDIPQVKESPKGKKKKDVSSEGGEEEKDSSKDKKKKRKEEKRKSKKVNKDKKKDKKLIKDDEEEVVTEMVQEEVVMENGCNEKGTVHRKCLPVNCPAIRHELCTTCSSFFAISRGCSTVTAPYEEENSNKKRRIDADTENDEKVDELQTTDDHILTNFISERELTDDKLINHLKMHVMAYNETNSPLSVERLFELQNAYERRISLFTGY